MFENSSFPKCASGNILSTGGSLFFRNLLPLPLHDKAFLGLSLGRFISAVPGRLSLTGPPVRIQVGWSHLHRCRMALRFQGVGWASTGEEPEPTTHITLFYQVCVTPIVWFLFRNLLWVDAILVRLLLNFKFLISSIFAFSKEISLKSPKIFHVGSLVFLIEAILHNRHLLAGRMWWRWSRERWNVNTYLCSYLQLRPGDDSAQTILWVRGKAWLWGHYSGIVLSYQVYSNLLYYRQEINTVPNKCY